MTTATASVDMTTAHASEPRCLAAEIIELADAIRTLAGLEAQNYSNHIETRRDFAAIWGKAGRIAASADKLSRAHPRPKLMLGYATVEERAEADRRSAAGVVAALPSEVWHPFCDAGRVIA